ncbi:hypothetical protein SAMN05660649_01988 [Desulfotomaculum arcticum]|uniref:Uncharacterized protein n=1 Tax=Desulfotruncus arcticus DSM 17038 TaxID=1121424 RepID=A0A1I2T0F7_9FIRM|nr:hypothetical protein [Desulfotruncus arcticus]SFG55916.1 hypothetical protein SAMN05660649_01988 [Desulfotomaculum arcticum] [Desulfotruncus arcticus DSM 17038]
MLFKFPKPDLKKPQRKGWPDPELARALAPLDQKVMQRYWLESARLALLWGIAAAVALLALSRLWLFSAFIAAGLGAAVTLLVAGLRIFLRPDALTLVNVADLTGLNGSAVTAYRLLEKGPGDAWALAAKNDSVTDCKEMSPALATGYAVARRKSWGGVALLAAMLLAYTFLPNPLASYWMSVRQEREALKLAAEEARHAVELVKDVKIKGNNVLTNDVKKQLESLPRDIKNSGDRQEAADKLEMARWQLDQARAVMGTTAKKDLERLAADWGNMSGKEWQGLSGAIQKGDPEAIDRAVQALEQAMQKTGDGERKQMAAALYSGAGAVSDRNLQQALKDAADAALDTEQKSEGTSGTAAGQEDSGLAAAAGALSGALANAAQTAGAGAALGSASASMASLASGLAGGGVSGNTGLASAGSGAMSGAGGAAAASGAASDADSSGSGAGDGSGTGGDGDGGSGQGGQNGAGSGNSGNGSGTGSGGQGGGGSGAGRTGGGLNMVYTPFLPGEGEKSQVAGQVRQGESGNEVSLESSPTTLGALRPYQEVYGQYMAEAHESISRAPLPPEMENLVWRYFSSLGDGTAE